MESDSPWPALVGSTVILVIVLAAVPSGGWIMCLPLLFAVGVVWMLSQR